MTDTYANYAALAAAQTLGVDYQLLQRQPQGSRVAHVAIHGGSIEPGTTELAAYLAGSQHLFYSLDGMKTGDNSMLYLNSISFDEPIGVGIVARSDYTVSWHADMDTSNVLTYIGGLDTGLGAQIATALTAAGFSVVVGGSPTESDGSSTSSLVNKNSRSMGVKLELTRAQCQAFFNSGDLSPAGRDTTNRTPLFALYADAVASAMAALDVPNTAPGITSLVGTGPSVPTGASLPGDFGVPTLSPLYVDGMPLAAVTETLRLTSSLGYAATNDERFWSSQPRPNGDPLREVYEFSLSVPRLANHLDFSCARFPQRIWMQYRDQDGVWQPLLQSGGSPVQLTVTDSLPALIPVGTVTAQHVLAHPQHFGAGHWMSQSVDFRPVTSSRFRLIMVRIPSSTAPRGLDGSLVPYSLGIKDVSVGYRLTSDADLPWRPLQDDSHTSSIAQGRDLLGSQVDYLLRRNRAAAVLTNGGTWRSKPQPVPHAVVSLFLDMRLPDGAGQILDRILVEPLTSGPTVNLYYAPTMPVNDWSIYRFTPSNEPLSFPQVKAVNSGVQADNDGLFLPGPADGVLVDNTAIQFDPYLPFLITGTVQPQTTSDDTSTLTILDNGLLRVTLQAGVLSVALGPATVTLDQAVFGFNATLPWALAYDGSQLTVRTPWSTRSQSVTLLRQDAVPASLMLGQPLAGGTGGRMRLTSLLLAQGRAQDITTIETYWENPSAYILPSGGVEDPASSTTANALLRLDGSLVTPFSDSVCPLGLIGGPVLDYDNVVWTPVNGDFRLMRQAFTFRPVKARLLKLEFTNLVPVLVNLTGEPLVKVNLFPNGTAPGVSTVAQAAVQLSDSATAGSRVTATTVQMFSDVPQRLGQPSYADLPYLPTEALFAPDPNDAQRLRQSGQAFRFLPLPGIHSPSWRTTGVHRYHVVEVALDTKTAYAVGVGRIHVYETDPGAQQDSEQYIELFHDTSHLEGYEVGDPTAWVATDAGPLVTQGQVGADGVRVESITYVSRSRIMGLQFAATQSDALQLVADPEMDDPSLQHWRPVGDASLASTDAYASDIGQMARVTRGHAAASWDAMEQRFASWDAIENSNPDPQRPQWDELEQSDVEANSGGIQSVRGVDPPARGRLFAAARVFTDQPLAVPLTLQLVNGDGTILAEQDANTHTSQVTEWVIDYDLGSGTTTGVRTWDVIAALGTGGGVPTWDQMEALGTWAGVSQGVADLEAYDVTVRLVQLGASGTGEWLVDSLAIFVDPVVWEFSRDGGRNWFEALDIRNDPHGVLVFPDLPSGDITGGTQLKWRVTGFTAGLSLSSVVLRPWYVSVSGAVPHLDSLQAAGGSSSLSDYYAQVDMDPFFQQWSSPIPQWWWLASKKWRDQNLPVPQVVPTVVLPGTLVEGTSEGEPAVAPLDSLVEALVLPS